MKSSKLNTALLGISLLLSTSAFAQWEVVKDPEMAGGGYRVVDNATGRALNTPYKTEKGAKRAAKALNKADKKAARGK